MKRLTIVVLLIATCFACRKSDGTLAIRVLDVAGQPVPARIELLGERGDAYVAEDALVINTE